MAERNEKKLMWEAAVLYYQEKHTQQQIAALMGLSRQTVSKLLNDAVTENIVQITIRDPINDCEDLENLLCQQYGLAAAHVCAVSGKNEKLRQMMTVKAAASYLQPILMQGGLKIAVSWGRTIRTLIEQMPDIQTPDNLVFPLFGATDVEDLCFSSNEIARSLADKIGAGAQYAWFPYLTEQKSDHDLLKKTGYYKKVEDLWHQIDLALVGIGNAQIVSEFGDIIGRPLDETDLAGDIATHFFDANGQIKARNEYTLCAEVTNIQNAKRVVAIACGDKKTAAITGALKTGLLDVLITDEHTARQLL